MEPTRPYPFANVTIPEWLIVIVALLTAAACSAVAHTYLTDDSFFVNCARRGSPPHIVLMDGRHAFTVGAGFALVAVAAILALSRTIRQWLRGLIVFFGIGGIVTALAGSFSSCPNLMSGFIIAQVFAVLVLFLPGMAATLWSVVEVRRAHRSIYWPRTSGKILESGVKVYERRRHNWEWRIRYRYRVNGVSFERTRVFFGTTIGLAEAESIVARFPTGAEVPVRYAPGKPGVSVLMPGVNRNTYSALFVGPTFLWIAAAIFGFFVL